MKVPVVLKAEEHQRTTRWDLIKKRHVNNCPTFKSEAVKRLIEMDFVGEQQTQRLISTQKELNPAVVMQLRHEMCKRASRSLPLATVQQKHKNDWCKQHNQLVEERHNNNELNKLRQQFTRQTARYYVEVPLPKTAPSISMEIDNQRLYESLKKTAKHVKNFYKTPMKALDEMEVLFEEAKENLAEDISSEIQQCIAEIERSESASETLEVCEGVRCVRFEQCELQRQNSICSNSSDELDSVISDLAEEALQELREEEALKLQAQNETLVQDETLVQEDHTLINESVNETLIPAEEVKVAALTVRRLELPVRKVSVKESTSITTDSDDDKSTVSNQEQSKIIEKLFQARAHTNLHLLRKYFLKWTHYTTLEKISRENFNCKATRVQQINAFLDKLRKEKTRINKQPIAQESQVHDAEDGAKPIKQVPPQLTKKYQNKIKIQQDIIDMQRMKLERQERIIMELKLHKLSEEARYAREELKQELKMVIQSGDPKAKAKAKCLQLIGNLRDKQDVEEEELARLQGKALFLPKFLQNMQERSLERSIRHEQARQRRLKSEAEREALKIAAEEARRQEDEQAKQQRLEALREKRRLEKWAKIQREQQRHRAIENHRKSLNFCRYLILRRVGMEGFKRLLERKRHYLRLAEDFKRTLYKRSCFRSWKDYSARAQATKLLNARLLHEKLLKRRVWGAWQAYISYERSNYLVAVDWYELRMTETIFKAWYYHVKRNQLHERTQMRQASSHFAWHTKWKVLDCWRRLPQILQIERETELRRQRWRLKIWELLPDYQPNIEN